MATPIIQFDYEFSPYGQKTRLLLAAAGVPFAVSLQPAVLPRPILESLGITYRRIPLLAVGRDIYADSSAIVAAGAARGAIRSTAADAAFEAWGNAVFGAVLGLIPGEILTPGFLKDRETVFPTLLRPDFATLRPSELGEFRANLAHVEGVMLAGGPFVGGEGKIGVADVHVAWVLRWVLQSLGVGKEEGFGADAFPGVWRWLDSLPAATPEQLTAEQATKAILDAAYAVESTGVDAKDPLGLAAGTEVTIESLDSSPGAHPQSGKLVGTGINEIVLELQNGVRLHFPRGGYIVRKK